MISPMDAEVAALLICTLSPAGGAVFDEAGALRWVLDKTCAFLRRCDVADHMNHIG